MASTTMSFSGDNRMHAASAVGHRRSARRPIFDLAPWIGPFAWMAVLALVVAAMGGFALTRHDVPPSAAATIRVRVSPSDTLWSIAKANHLPGVSTAETVEAIALANGIDASSLAPGAVLLVPSEAPVGSALAESEPGAMVR